VVRIPFIDWNLAATLPGRKVDQTNPIIPSKLRSPAPKPGTGIQGKLQA